MAVIAMNSGTPNSGVLKKLVELLNLQGQGVRAVTIRFAVGQPVMATVERFIEPKEADGFVDLLAADQPEIRDAAT